MTAPVRALRPDQPADAPDAPGVAFSAWNYGHELARSGVPAKLGAGPCAVLHTLASHANKQAQAEVGFGCLARETGQCRRAVIKAIARLIECRAIGRLQRRDDDTMVNAVNLYTIFPLEGIVAHPAPERRREQARALARRRPGGSERTVTTSERPAPSERTVTRGSEHTVTTPSERTVTRVVNTRAPKASPLSIPLLSIPHKHPFSASPRTGPRAERANGVRVKEQQTEDNVPTPTPKRTATTGTSTNGTTSKGKERACKTPEEEAEREDFLHRFGERIKPVGQTDVGRFRNEALRAIRAYGYREMCGCLDAMASSKRFVGQPFVSPVTVAHNVLTWQEAGAPRTWRKVEEWAQNKAQRQGTGVTW